MKTFLMDLISLLRVGDSKMNTGLMQFSEKRLTTTIMNLALHSAEEMASTVQKMKYHSGIRTMTGHALRLVNEEVCRCASFFLF